MRLLDTVDETIEKIPFVRLVYWELIMWKFRRRTGIPCYLVMEGKP